MGHVTRGRGHIAAGGAASSFLCGITERQGLVLHIFDCVVSLFLLTVSGSYLMELQVVELCHRQDRTSHSLPLSYRSWQHSSSGN